MRKSKLSGLTHLQLDINYILSYIFPPTFHVVVTILFDHSTPILFIKFVFRFILFKLEQYSIIDEIALFIKSGWSIVGITISNNFIPPLY